MSRGKKYCRICNKEHQLNLKGFLSYPKHLLLGKLPNYLIRVTQILNEKQTKRASISDHHICYIINEDVCDSCWKFMYSGFQCVKCNTFNYKTNQDKKCCLCSAPYCKKCNRRAELFSQNGLCTICQLRHTETLCSIRYLFSLFVSLIFPCIAFKYLLTRLIETFDKFQYTNYQKIMGFSSFVVVFPLIYCICLIGLSILLIGKIIKKIVMLN